MSPLGRHQGQAGATRKTLSWGLDLACPATDLRWPRCPSFPARCWPEGHMSQGGVAFWMRTSVTWHHGCMWSVPSSLPVTPLEHPCVRTSIISSAVLLATHPQPHSAASCARVLFTYCPLGAAQQVSPDRFPAPG